MFRLKPWIALLITDHELCDTKSPASVLSFDALETVTIKVPEPIDHSDHDKLQRQILPLISPFTKPGLVFSLTFERCSVHSDQGYCVEPLSRGDIFESVRTSGNMLHTLQETSKCSHLELVLEDLPDVPYKDRLIPLEKSQGDPVYFRTPDRSEISLLECFQDRCDTLIGGVNPVYAYGFPAKIYLDFPSRL
ncbi:hypothetical protein BD310DRAFT_938030 [Dichomitus squalens]|uniref:Uncharacterized protein n=1 Tax=Dichomitus squalens TaxID=114155 RepID=A0A4Q9PEW8_9APHY|nr:hypothetical protein BD310DRAFT_938030 [Dichomitus squalens]